MYSVLGKASMALFSRTMKFLTSLIFCLIVISFASSATTPKKTEKKIECEIVYGKPHKRHIIMNGINRPYQLAAYNHEHQIFFSYNVDDDTKDTFDIAYVKINDTEPTKVHGVKNGFALAVDEHNKKIYFGGSEGVYDGNLTKFEGIQHVIRNHDIWDIFYHKHRLYFIDYPSQQLHEYNVKENKTVPHEHIKEKIYQFVIDGNNDAFITTRDGLFEIKNNTKHRIRYDGPKIFRALEVNHKGVTHFCAKSGIYVADKENHTLTEIASIKNIFGLTFDADDNIIYSNPHEIVKLVPHNCK